jgi:hypothetical protein
MRRCVFLIWVLYATATFVSFMGCAGPDAVPGNASSGSSACVASKSKSPIADSCGIFVSSSLGNDMGNGTKAKPYKTIGAAIAKASGRRVYACAELFTEAVTISSAVELYGGFDCSHNWTYDGANRTSLTAAADAIPMIVASGAAIHDFAIEAADATVAGGSSIAVLDNGADLSLENVDLRAGAGVAGMPGAAQTKVMTPATANGGFGHQCDIGPFNGGGVGGQNICGGIHTDGGVGGEGRDLRDPPVFSRVWESIASAGG